MNAIRATWEARKARSFPDGALTFHLRAWSRGEAGGRCEVEAGEAFRRFTPEELVVLHGSAWHAADGVTVVSGPAGIGKSTVLLELEREGKGRLIEDGVLLVAARKDGWDLVTTGTNDVMRRASMISKRLRRFLRADFSFWTESDSVAARRARPLMALFLCDYLPRAAFALATWLARSPRERFEPALVPIRRLVLAYHAEDPHGPVKVASPATLSKVEDVRSMIHHDLELRLLSPVGSSADVRKRLRSAVTATTWGEAEEENLN